MLTVGEERFVGGDGSQTDLSRIPTRIRFNEKNIEAADDVVHSVTFNWWKRRV